MAGKYYFDTSVWRDHYENRFGLTGRPLGDYATKLFIKVIREHDTLFFSEFVARELKSDYGEEEINNMLNLLFIAGALKKVKISEENYKEANKIAVERNLPAGDALHAILARNNKAILVSQDRHFQKLKDIVKVKRPEEII